MTTPLNLVPILRKSGTPSPSPVCRHGLHSGNFVFHLWRTVTHLVTCRFELFNICFTVNNCYDYVVEILAWNILLVVTMWRPARNGKYKNLVLYVVKFYAFLSLWIWKIMKISCGSFVPTQQFRPVVTSVASRVKEKSIFSVGYDYLSCQHCDMSLPLKTTGNFQIYKSKFTYVAKKRVVHNNSNCF